jgi:hypothetical protein
VKITDEEFLADMADAFHEGVTEALDKQSDAFSFPYLGGDGSPAGIAGEMKCLVLLMPAPLADLMQEGIPVIRENLAQVLAEMAKAGKQ